MKNHLRRTLSAFADHYNANRTHLSLGKDAPDRRTIEREGEVISIDILGGLHYRYARRATTKDSNIR